MAGWVEVELGVENQKQLKEYRGRFKPLVRSFVGPRSAGGDLSLEEFAEFVDQVEKELDPQQLMPATIFTRLVGQAIRPISRDLTYKMPGEHITSRPLIEALAARLSEIIRLGIPPIAPGELVVSTIHQGGWTLRAFSKEATARSVSLLRDTAIGSGRIRVPSYTRLTRCLPAGNEALQEYRTLMASLGANIEAIGEDQNLAIEEERLVRVADPLAGLLKRMAETYGALPGSKGVARV